MKKEKNKTKIEVAAPFTTFMFYNFSYTAYISTAYVDRNY